MWVTRMDKDKAILRLPAIYNRSEFGYADKASPQEKPPQPFHNPRKKNNVMGHVNPLCHTPPPRDPLLIQLLNRFAGKSEG